MSDFINKLSIYDQLGFIVVGGLFYFFFDYDVSYFGLSLKNITENAFGIAVAVYFLGHVAQAVANQLIKEDKEKFNSKNTELLKEIKQHFNIPDYSDGEAFGICYMWALSTDKTTHVETMNARYGLYRGWFVVLFLQSLFYIFIISRDMIDCKFFLKNFIGISFVIPICILMRLRSKRFYKNISDKTFQTFILYRKNLINPQQS